MRSYCTAQGTISNLLGQNMMEDNMRKIMCTYMCVCVYNWVTLLYNRNWHNIVNQLYFNFKKVKKNKNDFHLFTEIDLLNQLDLIILTTSCCR